MKTPAAPYNPTRRGDTLSRAVASPGIGHSLDHHSRSERSFRGNKFVAGRGGQFGIWPLGHSACGPARLSTFPSQVTDLTRVREAHERLSVQTFNPFYPAQRHLDSALIVELLTRPELQISYRSLQITLTQKPTLIPPAK